MSQSDPAEDYTVTERRISRAADRATHVTLAELRSIVFRAAALDVPGSAPVVFRAAEQQPVWVRTGEVTATEITVVADLRCEDNVGGGIYSPGASATRPATPEEPQ